MSFQTMTPGMLMLGRIKEFLGSELAVTLPGGLRGYVSPFDISDVFTTRLQSLEEGVKSEDDEVRRNGYLGKNYSIGLLID
jgi:hypothetical protein